MRVKEKVEENMKVVEMAETEHLIRNSYKVMMGKMKKLMKNLEGVGMNTNKILITGLREGHQMNRAKKSYRSMPLSFPTIFLTIFLLFCLLLFANLAIAQSAELSKKYPELQKLQDAGGSVIGELDYNLDPGWWQYFQSCDRAKWVSYGQKFEPRSDYRASCDQQKHDFESVVKPTLSKTTEIVVPANGKIVLLTELGVSKEYHKEPAVSFTLQKKDGSSGTVGSPTWSRVSYANGTKIGSAPPKLLNWNAVEKGDKIIIKIEAGWYAVFHTRAIPTQGARVQVFFIPDDSDLEFKWSVKDNPSLNLPPMGREFKFAGNAGETMNDEATTYGDPTRHGRTAIENRIKEIDKLPPELQKEHELERHRLYCELREIEYREDTWREFWKGLSVGADKSLGYHPATCTVWGLSTGTIQLIQGNYKDAMNRYLGVIPWINLGTAYSALLDILSLYPPINYEESKKWDPLAQPRPPDDPAPVIFLNQ